MGRALSAKERWLECVRQWRLHPDAPGGGDCWAPELERASRSRLEEIQSEKITAAAAYLYEDSPFYRAKFDEVGLRPADVRSVEDLRERLERAWGATAFDVFGGAEVAMAPLGYQCADDARRDGPPFSPHLMEDCYAVEIVDPSNGEPMPEGSTGITVVSNLFSEAQPILRFEMADLMELTSAPCPCGRTQRRAIGGVLGREDDVLKVRGRAVWPSGFEAAVRSVAEAADEFEVVIDRRGGGVDEVLVRVEAALGAGLVAHALAWRVVDAVRRELGLDVSCQVVAPGTLRRVEAKARRVHDRRRVTATGADRA